MGRREERAQRACPCIGKIEGNGAFPLHRKEGGHRWQVSLHQKEREGTDGRCPCTRRRERGYRAHLHGKEGGHRGQMHLHRKERERRVMECTRTLTMRLFCRNLKSQSSSAMALSARRSTLDSAAAATHRLPRLPLCRGPDRTLPLWRRRGGQSGDAQRLPRPQRRGSCHRRDNLQVGECNSQMIRDR